MGYGKNLKKYLMREEFLLTRQENWQVLLRQHFTVSLRMIVICACVNGAFFKKKSKRKDPDSSKSFMRSEPPCVMVFRPHIAISNTEQILLIIAISYFLHLHTSMRRSSCSIYNFSLVIAKQWLDSTHIPIGFTHCGTSFFLVIIWGKSFALSGSNYYSYAFFVKYLFFQFRCCDFSYLFLVSILICLNLS